MTAALKLDRRLERAAQALAYLVIGLPIAALAILGVLATLAAVTVGVIVMTTKS